MSMMTLSDVADILKTPVMGESHAEFDTVCIDSRTLQPGELFVALKGPHFNGHQFIEAAREKGAVAAIVSELPQTNLPHLCVPDTKLALADLARYQRSRVSIPVIAGTGSCGKTTTRAMIANIFRQCSRVLASESSFNNDIGVPLTLLRLREDHDYAIFELGANHAGEIAYLTDLVKPTLAFITNARAAHLAGFGDIAGVARAKGEIFQGLAHNGIAVLNCDDPYFSYWRTLVAKHRIITFGLTQTADVTAKDIRFDQTGRPTFLLRLSQTEVEIQLPLLGEHNIYNALTAAVAADAFNLPITAIKKGLETVVPVKRRLVEKKGPQGSVIIDDSYNANPSSVNAAIGVLTMRSGEKILVLGDMLELGEASDALHRDIGEKALRAGVQQLYGYGQHTRQAVLAFGKQGFHFDDKKTLVAALKNKLHDQVTVLVKGSLSMDMGFVVAALVEE